MSRHQPLYRTLDDRQFTPPPAQPEADEVGRTAQQVRLDHENTTVHRLRNSWSDPLAGASYLTACEEVVTKHEGAILTTRAADCWFCLNGETRPNR